MDAFSPLFDDRPMFPLTLSWSEALALQSACSVAGMLSDGQMEGVAAYALAHAGDVSILDDLYDRLRDVMTPAREALCAEIKALAAEHRERLLDELDES